MPVNPLSRSVINEVDGDLLDPAHNFDAIGHGVNLRGVMGAGIAALIAKRWPDIEAPYRQACREGDLTLGDIQTFAAEGGPTIINMATQDRPGPNAERRAVQESLVAALEFCVDAGFDSFGLPQIGCGIGGLDWLDIRSLIEKTAADYPAVKVTVVYYVPTTT